jgi:high-affinity Fe2+/Pb2+ permease
LIAFAGFGVVIAAGIGAMIYAIIVNMVLNGTRPAFGILLIAFLLFAAMALGYVVWREALNEKRAKLRTSVEPNALPPPSASTGPLLEDGSIEPAPSVVEDTTRLLKHPRN